MPRFVLDHNYPEPIIEIAQDSLAAVDLTYLHEIDSRLPDFAEDWRLLLALHHHDVPWDGMITNDANILNQARELAVLAYTQLTLVAPAGVGHNPIRSTGLVLTHIERIAAQTTPRRPQIWRLTGRTPAGSHPALHLERLAKRQAVDPLDLRREAAPSRETLETDPLA